MKLSRGSVAAVLVLLVAGPAGVAGYKLRQQLVTGTGVAATQLCALEFVAGLDRKRARELYIDPLIREAASILRVETDTDRQAVTASVPGIVRQVAFHRPGYGCTLERDGSAPLQALPDARSISLGMALDRAHRDAVFDVAKLEAAVDGAFRQDPERPLLNTLAVVVLHDGKLVAERYAEGVAPDTRLPGWSMAKSVTATLVGVLVERGVVDVHAPGAISEWRDTDDPRSEISLDHLLRMTSGLLITESADRGDGLDPNSRMLYHEADAARFAATRVLHWDVGTHFEYMSGNFVLAMRAAQEAIGGDLRQAHAFIHEHLFEPLKMQGVVFEPDQAGTFLGSSHLFASARDWARFGQLYVDGGMAGDRRLIPEDWVDYVTTPTRPSTHSRRGDVFWEPGRSAYGAGFWLFADDTREAGEVSAALPGDAFDANGFQGQYTHIIPSEKLVVVRLGATNFRGPDYERLPLEVLAAKLEDGRAFADEGHRIRDQPERLRPHASLDSDGDQRKPARIPPRPGINGRSRVESMPGAAAQTAGMALIARIPVDRQPPRLPSPLCSSARTVSWTMRGLPSISIRLAWTGSSWGRGQSGAACGYMR